MTSINGVIEESAYENDESFLSEDLTVEEISNED